MRLSPAAELAVRGTVVLAEEFGRGPIALQSICDRRDLPKQYLIKIFSSLSRAGIVHAIRGKKGGYVLTRAPAEISLLEVIEAIDGRIELNYCQQEPPQCEDLECPIRPLWGELQHIVRSKLARMSLAQCLKP